MSRLLFPYQCILGKVKATLEAYSHERHFESLFQVRVMAFMLSYTIPSFWHTFSQKSDHIRACPPPRFLHLTCTQVASSNPTAGKLTQSDPL